MLMKANGHPETAISKKRTGSRTRWASKASSSDPLQTHSRAADNSNVTDLERSHAEVRATVILAGKRIRKLTSVDETIPSCPIPVRGKDTQQSAMFSDVWGNAPFQRIIRFDRSGPWLVNKYRWLTALTGSTV
jgi:hypothetical protein